MGLFKMKLLPHMDSPVPAGYVFIGTTPKGETICARQVSEQPPSLDHIAIDLCKFSEKQAMRLKENRVLVPMLVTTHQLLQGANVIAKTIQARSQALNAIGFNRADQKEDPTIKSLMTELRRFTNAILSRSELYPEPLPEPDK
jgi:hypothetical protein